MNLVFVTGNLARDVNYIPGSDGKRSSARFTIATQRNFKNKDGKYDADFIQCSAFGNTADFLNKYFKKGSSIEVRGTWRTGSYEKDGTKVYTNDCFVDEVSFGASNPTARDGESQPKANTVSQNTTNGFMNIPDTEEEELPWK